jgi:4-aminobutyrate aminotransferase / (S)-3-amino-2-methylpropionate transaminase / 5-aminovalerate transaminase
MTSSSSCGQVHFFHGGDCTQGSGAGDRIAAVRSAQSTNDNVAAIVIEPIQGEGGFVVPATGFLPAIANFARANGTVFVADEIQTGFCRTGAWFACDHEAVVPNLITTAKGIAGGLPLAHLLVDHGDRPSGCLGTVNPAGSRNG